MNIEDIRTRPELTDPTTVSSKILDNGEIETTEYFSGTDAIRRVTREKIEGGIHLYCIVHEFDKFGSISIQDCLVYGVSGELLFRSTDSYFPNGDIKQAYYIGCDKQGDCSTYKLYIRNVPKNFELSLHWTEIGDQKEIQDPSIIITKLLT